MFRGAVFFRTRCICVYILLLCPLQVVQEYERAVIFRLGRLLPVGAKGPGITRLIILTFNISSVATWRTRGTYPNPNLTG